MALNNLGFCINNDNIPNIDNEFILNHNCLACKKFKNRKSIVKMSLRIKISKERTNIGTKLVKN